MDFVIVGGGIYGCSVAWEIARRGGKVLLLEANTIAAGASGGQGKRGVRANGRDLRELPLLSGYHQPDKPLRADQLRLCHQGLALLWDTAIIGICLIISIVRTNHDKLPFITISCPSVTNLNEFPMTSTAQLVDNPTSKCA